MTAMKRDISALGSKTYDVVIVGGGMFGACAAWEAASRGLSAAVVDKGDFCHATSANHFKMVHGGIRYLQHADVVRIRESSRERSALLRIAPHLVRPLPIVIPTYGHGMKGKEILGAGIMLYDMLTMDRNRGIVKDRNIPPSRFLSRHEVLALFPGIKEKQLTGGALFYDGQMYNPPRLVLSFLKSAISHGADAGNYLKVTGFLREKNRITGVKVTDMLDNTEIKIRANMVLNASGPWAHQLLQQALGKGLDPCPTYSRDLAFVVKRKFSSDIGVAFSTYTKDSDTLIDRGGRHLFAVPWRQFTLIGVWHVVFEKTPENITVGEDELQCFVDEVNSACPGLDIHLSEIQLINTGLTLFGDKDSQGSQQMSFGKRSEIVDHSRTDQIDGLVTLLGVRATTARGMAQKTVDMIFEKLGKSFVASETQSTPIHGGHMHSFQKLLDDAMGKRPAGATPEIMTALVHNHGCDYPNVLKYVNKNSQWGYGAGETTVLQAEIIHGIREEMAQKLSDIVFRRTDIGTGENPGAAVECCAELMADEMGWGPDKTRDEINEVKQCFPHFYRTMKTGHAL
ncbi:MAG: FAD-dependent oxidoreductase [Desulfobacterales bacterium]|nr:FAD-dependent oxidoreductase [Desulfobacterales bacterium]MDD4392776.1 FAD-dependent oxidoreductase [Desulfobacterales bacterium]